MTWPGAFTPGKNETLATRQAREELHQLLAERDRLIDPNRKGPKCALALVAAGFKRTGSTMQEGLVRHALRQLCLPIAATDYWEAPIHVNQAAAPSLAAFQKVMDRRHVWSDPNAVLLYKSHQFKQNLLGVCRQTIIFTSHRCVRDVVASGIAVGWTSARATPQSVVKFFTNSLAEYERWKLVGALDIGYEMATRSPAQTINFMRDFIALKLGMDTGMRCFAPPPNATKQVSYPTAESTKTRITTDPNYLSAVGVACGQMNLSTRLGWSCCVGDDDRPPELRPPLIATATAPFTLGKSADFQPTKSSRPRNTLRARSKASQGRSMT